MDPSETKAVETTALDEMTVASQLTVTTDQVIAFCRDKGFRALDDGHYSIPTAAVPEIEAWAIRQGYLQRR